MLHTLVCFEIVVIMINEFFVFVFSCIVLLIFIRLLRQFPADCFS